MKLKDLYVTDDDLFFCGMDGDRDDRDPDEYRKEKKDKRDKDDGLRRDKDHGKHHRNESPEEFHQRLKEMSKGDLRSMALDLGIDPEDVDMTSKKAMRKAIMKAKGIKRHKPEKSISDIMEEKGDKKVRLADDARMPYYLNEDTGDFVIPDALTCEPLVCYDAMQSLGYMRGQKNADDGFAEMVRRIGDSLAKEYRAIKAKEGEPVIDVDFRVVEDDKDPEFKTVKMLTSETPKQLPPSATPDAEPKNTEPRKRGSKYRK